MENRNIRKEFIWHKLYRVVGSNKISDFIRKFLIGILSPWYFLSFHNHFKSCIKNRAIDKKGNFLPWFVYPLVELLKNTNFENKKILEFGSGCSTHFFLDKGCFVVSYEEDLGWYEYISQRKSEKFKFIHRFVHNEEDKLEEISGKKFDLIIIDGHERQFLLNKLVKMNLLNDNGAIIFDNSEGYKFSETVKNDEFKNFQKVDFYGHVAGGFRKHSSTILFFKNCNCFLFNRNISLLSSNELNSPL